MLNPDAVAKAAKKLVYQYKNWKRLKGERFQRKQKRKDRKQERIALIGKTRYYLSQLFGQWIIYQ
jgi:hypothetical protein